MVAITRIGVGGAGRSYGTISAKIEALSNNGQYNAVAEFPTGQSDVVIAVYDTALSIIAGTLVPVTLTSGRCVELGTTGMYYWNSGNLAMQPNKTTEYLWQMTDGVTNEEDIFIIEVDSRCHAVLCR